MTRGHVRSRVMIVARYMHRVVDKVYYSRMLVACEAISRCPV